MTTATTDSKTWPELGIALYDLLTARNAEIAYTFDDFQMGIPSSAKSGADHANWNLNGTIRITTRDNEKN